MPSASIMLSVAVLRPGSCFAEASSFGALECMIPPLLSLIPFRSPALVCFCSPGHCPTCDADNYRPRRFRHHRTYFTMRARNLCRYEQFPESGSARIQDLSPSDKPHPLFVRRPRAISASVLAESPTHLTSGEVYDRRHEQPGQTCPHCVV